MKTTPSLFLGGTTDRVARVNLRVPYPEKRAGPEGFEPSVSEANLFSFGG